MTESTRSLQLFGPQHALSSHGLHLREDSGLWQLVVPMPAELLKSVRVLCERLAPAEALRVLGLLERYLRADLERLQVLRESDSAGGVE